jgi:hypothetical protein
MSGDRLALWWVDRYTRGLRPDTRAERRAEIASDLWEHRQDAGNTWSTHVAIVWRCLRGVPADLSWRRSRARRRRALPAPGPLLRGAGWAIASMAYAFLVVQHAWFASALLGLDLYGADWAPGDVERWSRISGVLVAALLGGAPLLRATPRLGAALVAGASLGTAGLMWWALPMIGPIALAVATGAVVIARRRRRALGGG